MIDLRSDTVTKPSARMRKAMAEAEVGDDVYREDPTVNQLERRAAEISGKEDALFLPTGTMGNTIALKLHTRHGEEVLCDARSHILDWELSMLAWFAGCLVRTVQTTDGILEWKQIEGSLRKFGPHNAPTTGISVENTHNMAGGTVYPQDVLDEICGQAHVRGLKVHMDGARVFNASIASGTPVSRILRDVDTAMFCLSKGLGAPVGSMLVGTKEAMEQGRLLRKRLGGGMRQAGVLAAAGLIALQESPQRLGEDHANARLLADKLAALPGITLEPEKVRTNIVIFDIAETGLTPLEMSAELKARNVLANGVDRSRMRMVTHMDVSRGDCELAGEAVSEIVTAKTAKRASV
jgi:threonine aldolase